MISYGGMWILLIHILLILKGLMFRKYMKWRWNDWETNKGRVCMLIKVKCNEPIRSSSPLTYVPFKSTVLEDIIFADFSQTVSNSLCSQMSKIQIRVLVFRTSAPSIFFCGYIILSCCLQRTRTTWTSYRKGLLYSLHFL